ncbi:ATP-binding protein [Streptomyces sp. DSM 44915]|uniref:ATP-binding protein n=1 Tax=Streptomyces chisholmiae TaxID=3075540 RepID=A0ABU2K1N8_9ACTN|nr:ATP-binding protein [Streptomyces sp. DSM 44915]MDT0270679.1 ATP-binding protein [Streptomyces sp. DSM 44915]
MSRTFHFPAGIESPGKARKAVREAVLAWSCGEDIAGIAELLTSELVTNSVLHSPESQRCLVEVDVSDGLLTVGVTDRGAGSLKLATPGLGDESGRGLALVRALSASWGFSPTCGGGKRVHFSLDVPMPPSHVYEQEVRHQGRAVDRETWRDTGVTDSVGQKRGWVCPRLRFTG